MDSQIPKDLLNKIETTQFSNHQQTIITLFIQTFTDSTPILNDVQKSMKKLYNNVRTYRKVHSSFRGFLNLKAMVDKQTKKLNILEEAIVNIKNIVETLGQEAIAAGDKIQEDIKRYSDDVDKLTCQSKTLEQEIEDCETTASEARKTYNLEQENYEKLISRDKKIRLGAVITTIILVPITGRINSLALLTTMSKKKLEKIENRIEEAKNQAAEKSDEACKIRQRLDNILSNRQRAKNMLTNEKKKETIFREVVEVIVSFQITLGKWRTLLDDIAKLLEVHQNRSWKPFSHRNRICNQKLINYLKLAFDDHSDSQLVEMKPEKVKKHGKFVRGLTFLRRTFQGAYTVIMSHVRYGIAKLK